MMYRLLCIAVLTISLPITVTAQDTIQTRTLDDNLRIIQDSSAEIDLEINYSKRAGFLPIGLKEPTTVYSYGPGFRANIARHGVMMTVKGNLSHGWLVDATFVNDYRIAGPARIGFILNYNQMRRDDPILTLEDMSIWIRRRAILGTFGIGGGVGKLKSNYLRAWAVGGYYNGKHIVVSDISDTITEPYTSILANDRDLVLVGAVLRGKFSHNKRFEAELNSEYLTTFRSKTSSALPPQELTGSIRLSIRILGPVWVTGAASIHADQRFINNDQRLTAGFKFRRRR